MIRQLALAIFVVGSLWSVTHGQSYPLVSPNGVFGQNALAAEGLHRQWFSQVQLDGDRHRVAGMTLYRGMLYVGTTAGLVHAFDAETGETLWKHAYGKPYYPYSPPGFSEAFAAFQRGTTLYVASRDTGAIVWEKQLKGTLGVAPAILDDQVLVALPIGKIESYFIDEPTRLPLVVASFGRVSTSPILSAKNMIWATDRAKIMLKGRGRYGVQREITIPASVKAPITLSGGMLYVAAMDGNIYSILESDASFVWQFTADGPVRQRMVLADDHLYAVTDARTLYSLDSKTGLRNWESQGVRQIVSVGADSVFALDDLERLLRIDRGSGQIESAVLVHPASMTFTNTQTDRLYFTTPEGVLTCLREADQIEPLTRIPTDAAAEETSDEENAEEVEAPRPVADPLQQGQG